MFSEGKERGQWHEMGYNRKGSCPWFTNNSFETNADIEIVFEEKSVIIFDS